MFQTSKNVNDLYLCESLVYEILSFIPLSNWFYHILTIRLFTLQFSAKCSTLTIKKSVKSNGMFSLQDDLWSALQLGR